MTTENQQRIEKLAELIEDNTYVMLTTVTDEGHLHACPMFNEMDDDDDFNGHFWFIASKQSETVQDIIKRPQVNLSFSDPSKGNFVSITGEAALMDNPAMLNKLWDKEYYGHFDGKDDPNIQLLLVKAHGAQYWDGDGSIQKFFKLAKSSITGNQASTVESKTVELA